MLAEMLGVTPGAVNQWLKKEGEPGYRPVPLAKCTGIELATGGAVTRKDLRPVDWITIWPELDGGNKNRRATDKAQA